jgi:nucleoside-diphosphate-sugar epimerase/ketosteroid isomerase-like protein
MRVLVTGGTGQIGPYLVTELIEAGHEVTGLARSEAAADALAALGATVRRGHLADLDGLKDAAAASDGVVHLAHRQDLLPVGGMDAVADAEVSIMLAYGEALAGTDKPLVVAGSIGSPGPLGRPVTEHDPALPSGEQYAGTLRSRNIVETTVLGLAERGVRSSMVRIANIAHSTNDQVGFVQQMISLAKEKGVVGYPGDGDNHWNAVHARDVATLFRLALEKGPAGSAWHAVAEGAIPFRDIAQALGSRLELPVVSIPADALMTPGYFGFLTALVTQSYAASNEVTRRTLGWEPTQPGLFANLDNGHYFPDRSSAGDDDGDGDDDDDDVATLREFVSRMGSGDQSGALAMVDENAVWHEAESLPWAGQWRGPHGFVALEDAISAAVEMSTQSFDIVEAGDVVEMRLSLVFTSRASGRRLPMDVIEHYTVREGRIFGANAFYKDTHAVNDLVRNG